MRLQSTRDGCAVSARSGVKQKSREQQRGQQQRGEGGTSAATLSGFTGGDGGGAGGVGAGEGGAGCLGPLKHTKANCDHGGSRQTPDPVKTLNTTRAKIFILIISSKFHKNRIPLTFTSTLKSGVRNLPLGILCAPTINVTHSTF